MMRTQNHTPAGPVTSAPVLISSTRSVRLSLLNSPEPLPQPFADPSTPKDSVLFLPGPTSEDGVLTRRFLADLMPSGFGQNHSVYMLQWTRLWGRQGQERFGPLVRDISQCTRTSTFPQKPFHLVSVGTGALLALKWFAEDIASNVRSLSLVEPSLSIQGRSPRTKISGLPEDVALIHGRHDASQNGCENMKDMLRRLGSRPVTFFAIENPTLFRAATCTFRGMADFNALARDYSGFWGQSWADWLSASTPTEGNQANSNTPFNSSCA